MSPITGQITLSWAVCAWCNDVVSMTDSKEMARHGFTRKRGGNAVHQSRWFAPSCAKTKIEK